MNSVLCLTDVTKEFRLGLGKKKTAVSGLSLEIPRGEVVGLLGPNGSGKSTTIKMILGFLQPTRGTIEIEGFAPHQIQARRFIGYLPENPKFQKFLTGKDTLRYFAHLLDLPSNEIEKTIEELLERVNLSHAGGERVRGYSKGMTQRLAIAQALLNRPKILILDEPMSGLDPIGRIKMRELIWQIHNDFPETTIFFSTHILDDVEKLCSQVALLKKGKLATYCNMQELLQQGDEKYEVVVSHVPDPLQKELKVGSTSAAGITLQLDSTDDLLKEVQKLRNAGARIVTISSHRRNLETTLFTDSTATSDINNTAKGAHP